MKNRSPAFKPLESQSGRETTLSVEQGWGGHSFESGLRLMYQNK